MKDLSQHPGFMRKINNKEYIFVEKYRPSTVKDLIIPEEMREKIISWVKDGQIPNIGIFSNTPGLGKTSISKAIVNDLDADSLFINASKDNGIDLVRNKVYTFASSVSFEGGTKIAILDEIDGTTGEFQKAFRAFIEEFSKNARFILTGNYKDRIIEAVLNRLMVFDFDNIFHKHKTELAKQILDRLCFILENENISYEISDVKSLVGTFYPSVREMINVLQQSVESTENGKVLKVDYTHTELNKLYNDLIHNIKEKNYEKCRVLASEVTSPNGFYKFVYKNIDKIFAPQSIPQVVVITHSFMATNTNNRDPEITIAAYASRLMLSVDIKFL